MTITIDDANRVAFPAAIRDRAQIKAGDELEVFVSAGVITMVPKLPVAHSEYTPEERRRILDAVRAADVEPEYGPFRDGDDVAAFLESNSSEFESRPRKDTF